MPVGSVEFVRAAMRAGGIKEPEPIGYPASLRMFYCRAIRMATAADARVDKCFVKPVQLKIFNGFVHREDGATYDEHDQEQLEALNKLPEKAPVWISDVVRWQSEFRYYVDGQKILGRARYDQLEAERVPEPDRSVVTSMIRTLKLRHPYALDVGVLEGGQTALVEINDAWALGLYQGALTPSAYLKFLSDRWDSLAASRKGVHHAHHAGALTV